MKKLIVLMVLGIFNFSTANAALMGFGNGEIFDPAVSVTEPQFMCFILDCLAKDGTIKTREELGLSPIPQTVITPIPQSTPQIVYVPVYVPQPIINNQPSQNVTPAVQVVKPAPAPAPTPDPTPAPRNCHMGGGRKIDPNCS